MRRTILMFAVVLVLVSAGAAMAGAVDSAAPFGEKIACPGMQAEVQAEMVASNRLGVSPPENESEAQPAGSWPDCPPEYSCGPNCHRDFFSCTSHSLGSQVCGWDGSINPPEFGCNKFETVHVQTCDCVPNSPGGVCFAEFQNLYCD